MKQTKKTVLVSGNFNVIHPGHLRLLRFAKEQGSYLIVAVQSDKIAGKAAHVPEILRLEGVNSNNWVDEAILLDEPIADFIKRMCPDIVVKGKEYQDRDNLEEEAVGSYGARLIFGSGESTFSSFDLLRKEFYESAPSDISLPQEFMSRHNIKKNKLIDIVTGFSSLKICVVGDLIIDEYITCEPLGMSQEDPTIVVTPVDTTKFLGGAGIVAAHAAGLGAEVNLLSVRGNDSVGDFAEKALSAAGVEALLLQDVNRPTTLKQRFRSKGKSLLRVNHLHQNAISPALQEKFMNALEPVCQKFDLLVFSDFNYGVLPQSLVNNIFEIAKKNNIILAADSQSSSQVGDISRFQRMHLITPTEREARISTRNHEDGLVVLAEQLRQQSSAHHVLLKLGEEGVLIHAGAASGKWFTDRVGALNNATKDVAGAGDSLLITSSLALANGANIWEASCLGTLAAAIQVGRVGNTPLKTDEFITELN